jgi:hypothetical protein
VWRRENEEEEEEEEKNEGRYQDKGKNRLMELGWGVGEVQLCYRM